MPGSTSKKRSSVVIRGGGQIGVAPVGVEEYPTSIPGRSMAIRVSNRSTKQPAAQLFEYFYLVHYQLNMVIEDVMRGPLPRKEAALLFLLYAEGGPDSSLPRKLVVDRLNSWFDSTSSNVTKIIARLASPRLNLVQVTNESGSARDKRISLSPKGRVFTRSMMKKGEDHAQLLLSGLSEDQIRVGLEFFNAASTATSDILPLKKLILGKANRK
jgi:DNA-binding MarR family transcriptional regulator